MLSALTGSAVERRLLSGSAWAMGSRLATLGGGVALNALLARTLRPADFGGYVLAVSVAGVGMVIAQLGLTQVVVRLLAECAARRRADEARAVISATLRIGGFASVAVGLLVIGGFELSALTGLASKRTANTVGLYGSLLVPLLTVRYLVAEAFRGLRDVRTASLLGDGALATVSSAAVAVALLVARGRLSLDAALRLTLLSALGIAFISIVLIQRVRLALPVARERASARHLLRISLPVLGVNAGWVVITQCDLLILGVTRPSRDVALYGAASKLALLVGTPLLVLNAATAPYVAQAFAERRASAERFLRVVATAATVPTAVGVLVAFAWGREALAVVYGAHYTGAAAVLLVLAVGQLVNAAAGACGIALIMTGAQAALLRITMLSAVGAIGGAFVAAELWGRLGVACSAALALGLQNVVMLIVLHRQSGVWSHTFGLGQIAAGAYGRLTSRA